jgi:hypothetical protein
MPAVDRVPLQGGPSIQQAGSGPAALPAARSGIVGTKLNRPQSAPSGPSVPAGVAVALLVAGALTILPARSRREWVVGSITIRGPPRAPAHLIV